MTAPASTDHRHTIGINRREVLQVGFSGLLGVSLPAVLGQRAMAKTASPAKSVLIIFCNGAPSHIDTFDMKPDAPPEVRGEFKAINTKVPGLWVCEHLPRLAARADKYAVVRSLAHKSNNHLMACHHVETGHIQPGAFFDKVASRDDWPCYASGYDYLRRRDDGMPNGVHLPMYFTNKALTWPGQHSGFLGPRYDPWQITSDPNQDDFRVDSLRLAPGLEIERLRDRGALLDQVNSQQKQLEDLAECRRLTDKQHLAFSVLTSGKIAQAFELHRESDAVRHRYGRHSYGQSLLLARRLIQTGVPVVQANMGRATSWDTHFNIFPSLKNRLLPPLDKAVAALLDDMEASGLLKETLVILLGEFGRTPKVGQKAPGGASTGSNGRDHWAYCFSAVFAGAGVRPGQVIGKSDKIGAYPITTPYSPDDLGATVYKMLGIPADAQVRDRQNRPVLLNSGKPIEALFTGAIG